MGGAIGIILGVLGVAKELFAYLRSREECKKTKAQKLLAMRDGLRTARTTGDTTNVETAFANLGLRKPADKLPNDGVVDGILGGGGTVDPANPPG